MFKELMSDLKIWFFVDWTFVEDLDEKILEKKLLIGSSLAKDIVG
tara:strand:- start:27 stop:161 length:135 start_codon:yes stop_codon:yes gene_type:complete